MDVASLGIKVDSSGVKIAGQELDKLSKESKKAETSTENYSTSTDKATKSATGLSCAAKALGVALAGAGVLLAVKHVAMLADQYVLLDNKLKLVTTSSQNLSYVQQELLNLSNKSLSAYSSSVDLFSRMARATEDLGTSQEDVLRITETLNKAMIISGATTQESANALIQLSQSFASGVMRGEEFNSVSEQGSRIITILTEHLKVNRGELREMAAEGKLTSEVMLEAFASATDAIDSEFSQMTVSMSQSMVILKNNFGALVHDLFGPTQLLLVEQFTGAISGISDSVDSNRSVLDAWATAFVTTIVSIEAEFMRLAMLIDKVGGTMTSMGMLLTGPGSFLGIESSEKRFEAFAAANLEYEARHNATEAALQRLAEKELELIGIIQTRGTVSKATTKLIIDDGSELLKQLEELEKQTDYNSDAADKLANEWEKVNRSLEREEYLFGLTGLDLALAKITLKAEDLREKFGDIQEINIWEGLAIDAANAADELDKAGKDHEEAADYAEGIWQNAFDNIADSMADWIKNGKLDLDSLGDYFSTVVSQMVSAWAVGQASMSFTGEEMTSGELSAGELGSFLLGSTSSASGDTLLNTVVSVGSELYSGAYSAGLASAQIFVSEALSAVGLTSAGTYVGTGTIQGATQAGASLSSTGMSATAFGSAFAGVGTLLVGLLTGEDFVQAAAEGLGAAGGFLIGAEIGSAIPIIGTTIGGIIGGALGALGIGSLFGEHEDNPKLEAEMFFGYDAYSGDIGLTGSEQIAESDNGWQMLADQEAVAEGMAEMLTGLNDAFVGTIEAIGGNAEAYTEAIVGIFDNASIIMNSRIFDDDDWEESMNTAMEDMGSSIVAPMVDAFVDTVDVGLTEQLSSEDFIEASQYLAESVLDGVTTELDAITDTMRYGLGDLETELNEIDDGFSQIEDIFAAISDFAGVLQQIEDAIAYSELSDLEADLKDVNDSFDTLAATLESLGVDLTEYTLIEEERAKALEAVYAAEEERVADILEPVEYAIAETGMSDLDIELRDINDTYDGIIESLGELAAEENTLLIEEGRNLAIAQATALAEAEAAEATAEAAEELAAAAETTAAAAEATAAVISNALSQYDDIFANQGLSDFQIVLSQIDGQYATLQATLEEAAASTEDFDTALSGYNLTVATAKETEISEVLEPVSDFLANVGSSDYEIQLNSITAEFDNMVDRLVIAGATAEELLDVQLWRDLSISALNLAEAETALAEAGAELEASFAEEQTKLYESHLSILEDLNEQLDTAKSSSSDLSSLTDTLRSTLDSMSLVGGGTAAIQWADAQVELFAALDSARLGDFSLASDLGSALSVLSQDSTDQFATYEDYQRDFWKTYLATAEIEQLAGVQLSEAEQTVALLEEQIEQEDENFDVQTDLLTEQLNTLLGIDESVLALADAIVAYTSAEAAIADIEVAEVATQTAYTEAVTAATAPVVSVAEPVIAVEAEPELDQNAIDLIGAMYAMAIEQAARAELIADDRLELQVPEITTVNPLDLLFGTEDPTTSEFDSINPLDLLYDLPSLDVGTNYLPEDMIIKAHKGEKITPAAYNRSDSTNADLVKEVKQLRLDMGNMLYNVAKSTKGTEDQLKRWDYDGIPEERVIA